MSARPPRRCWFQDDDGTFYRNCPLIASERDLAALAGLSYPSDCRLRRAAYAARLPSLARLCQWLALAAAGMLLAPGDASIACLLLLRSIAAREQP